MKAIILAAGRGSRMGNATDVSPKCMFEFQGRPLIEHVVTNLTKFIEFDDIYLISGYQSQQLEYLGLRSIKNHEWDETNIMGSLLCADSLLIENESIITYSDIYYEPAAVSKLLEHRSPAVLSAGNWSDIWHKRFINPLEDLENFSTDHEGCLVEIGGQVQNIQDVMGQFGGIYTLNPKVWEWLSTNVINLSSKDTTSTLNELIKQSPFKVEVADYRGVWAEIDTLSDAISQT